MGIIQKIKNIFNNNNPNNNYFGTIPYYKNTFMIGNQNTIMASIINKIAIDASEMRFTHSKLDANHRPIRTIESGLQRCLNISANIDQSGRALIQNIVESLLDEGVVCVVPIDYTLTKSGVIDQIYSMRVGSIESWGSDTITTNLYNENIGMKETITIKKKLVAIIENPMYSIMNTPNSTIKRLLLKLSMLDNMDEISSSGKLDLLIQLPYSVKSEMRKKEAESRRKALEDQLSNAAHGIAYIDGTEKAIQLNRPINNTLIEQIEYLTKLVYSQLGITTSIIDGSASERAMTNFTNRVVIPILTAISEEMTRKFLQNRTNEKIVVSREPFKLLTIGKISEVADKLTRNEIMTSNEVRLLLGLPLSSEKNADELRNKNLYKESPNESKKEDENE